MKNIRKNSNALERKIDNDFWYLKVKIDNDINYYKLSQWFKVKVISLTIFMNVHESYTILLFSCCTWLVFVMKSVKSISKKTAVHTRCFAIHLTRWRQLHISLFVLLFVSLDVLCKVNIVDNVINFIFSFDKFQLFVFWYVGYFIPFICLTFYSGI